MTSKEKELESIPMEPTAPPGEPGKGPRKPGKLWRWLFTVVLFPFLILGVPTHLLCWKSGDPRATSLKGWFRSIFIPFRPQSVILTIIFLCTTAFGTYAVFRWIFLIIWHLVILGEVDLEILDALYNLVQALPLYLPTVAIWLFGASIKSVLWGYDISQFELETLVASCYDIGYAHLLHYNVLRILQIAFCSFQCLRVHFISMFIKSGIADMPIFRIVQIQHSAFAACFFMQLYSETPLVARLHTITIAADTQHTQEG